MSLESIAAIDNRIIFKETFNSEVAVRTNPYAKGTPTNVTLNRDGTASFVQASSPGITYQGIGNFGTGNFTVRIRGKIGNFNNIGSASNVLLAKGTYLAVNSFSISTQSDNKLYVSVNQTNLLGYDTAINDSVYHDIVFTRVSSTVQVYIDGEPALFGTNGQFGLTVGTNNFFIGRDASAIRYINEDIDLVELYNYALTASEVYNLKHNRTYQPLPIANEVLSIDTISSHAIVDRWENTITNTDVILRQFVGSGKVMYYNGSTTQLSLGNIGTIRAISFWIWLDSTTEGIMDFDGGVNVINVAAGTLAGGTDRYIQGVNTDTIVAKKWRLVTVIDTTGIAASALLIGFDNTDRLKGYIGLVVAHSQTITLAEHTQLLTSTKHKYL
jgi:hypothetical protein